MKIEIKYLGEVVGYVSDGQTVEFLETKEAQKIKEEIFLKRRAISVSSRQTGWIDTYDDNKHTEIIDYEIISDLNN